MRRLNKSMAKQKNTHTHVPKNKIQKRTRIKKTAANDKIKNRTNKSKRHSQLATVTVNVPIVSNSTSNLLLKKPRKKRSKNGTRMYFTQETEDAIIQYNKEHAQETREKIFKDKILYPFQKLVENVFNTFKFSYFQTSPQDVQKECLTHLVANIHKFDPNRKSKADPKKKSTAFAYFSIIAKHYLILLNNTNYKIFNQNVEISDDRDENTVQLQQNDKYYAQQEMNDFIRLLVKFWENNIEKIFTKSRDLNIANAVVNLFRNSDRIDVYNKKALYLHIREMASCKTQQITKVINKMKQYHTVIQKSYLEDGDIETE